MEKLLTGHDAMATMCAAIYTNTKVGQKVKLMAKKNKKVFNGGVSTARIYTIRLLQMTPEKLKEAASFSLETLLQFAFNKLEETEKEIVQKEFRKNYCLLDRYMLIEEEIEINGFETIGQYKAYKEKLCDEDKRWQQTEEKYQKLHEKNTNSLK